MVCKKCGKFYFTGQQHVHYGIWNNNKKEFQFGICESTVKKARQKLFKKIGYESYKWRFEVREIKECEN